MYAVRYLAQLEEVVVGTKQSQKETRTHNRKIRIIRGVTMELPPLSSKSKGKTEGKSYRTCVKKPEGLRSVYAGQWACSAPEVFFPEINFSPVGIQA